MPDASAYCHADGKFKSFPAGQPIVQRGDVGNEMYVLINGSADVFIHAADQRRGPYAPPRRSFW